MEKILLTERDDIFVIKDFFSKEFCKQHIEKCESVGFGEATVNAAGGVIVNKRMRDNERVIVDDLEAAAFIWEKLREFIPLKNAIGMNERLRYYRYEPGQFFDWHYDGSFRRNAYEASRLTFLGYLNDEFEGGTTDFSFVTGVMRTSDPVITVKPEAGMALVFVHHVLHRGAPVKSGRKYVLRSDVMFKF